MGRFDAVHFRGCFRDCQQRVLDHFREYLDDGRLHIVAAPHPVSETVHQKTHLCFPPSLENGMKKPRRFRVTV